MIKTTKYISIMVLSMGLALSAFSKPHAYQLVWADEFENEGLPDSTKWNYDTKGNAWAWGNKEAQYYTSGIAENAYVSNGTLKITALKKQTADKEYSSARLTTKGKGDWKYGRIEIKAKVPGGMGNWPAIWMLPSQSEYGRWPKSGEIDIMEYVGHDFNRVHFTVHTESFNHKIGTQVGSNDSIPHFEENFHVFRLDWDADKCMFYLDDELKFTFSKRSDNPAEWPFDKEFHLLLNVAVGGTWGGEKGIDDTIFPNTMEVDYVRVYQKK